MPVPFSAQMFDDVFASMARSDLGRRLAAEAYGEDYPAEVRPFGMTTLWTLGRCVTALRVGPGHVLVDLACGQGGPGLWLARATGADLVGVDWSQVAVDVAAERAPAFVPDGRARYLVGDLAATGLPEDCADAVLCLDAVFFAEDRIAALREVRRLLRPAGRYVFTADEVDPPTEPRHVQDWGALLRAAGLELESKEEIPRFRERLGRMYELWLDHLDELEAEYGSEQAKRFEFEARTVGATLDVRSPVFVVARRPG
ncbi:MAG TPA: class I SAM-dependent methyltransferase [Gaiellaceae bacterium]|nr:class I SAM-dependent methyltransferase [Gaiellaceae bacterium]